jgi:hypothetical protein
LSKLRAALLIRALGRKFAARGGSFRSPRRGTTTGAFMLKRIVPAGLAVCALCIALPAGAMPAAKSIGADSILIRVDDPCKGKTGSERKKCLAEIRAENRKKKEHQEPSGGGRGGPGNGGD